MTMARLFGTDGVRGLANGELTAHLALDVAIAGARVLARSAQTEGRRARAVVGRDTRASGEFLSAAVIAGLAAAGVDVADAGVLPTPAIAHLVAETGADFGVVLSASHNPMPDNGIKFFADGGHKLPDEVEDEIESLIGVAWAAPTGADVGRVTELAEGPELYVRHLLAALPHRLDGLKVVADFANGAASVVGPEVLRRAGAQVVALGTEADGLNINDHCGSTHIDRLQQAVVAHGADAGVAFDGDADRCLAVDAEGNVVDGDQEMGILALALDAAGQLARHTLVVTVMSNLGLLLAMKAHGIATVQTAVGDRYVLEELLAGGFNLGGEQSGHVILLDHVTTGDGLMTALTLLSRVTATGRPLAELAGEIRKLPQVLVNVRVADKSRAETDEGVRVAVKAAEAELGETGRVLLRPSGTESLVRVMVEAATQEKAQLVTDRLARVVAERLV